MEISRDVSASYLCPIVAAKVDNDFRDLQSTVLVTAVKEICAQVEVTVEHSLNKGLYCELYIGRELTHQDVAMLKQKMQAIINENHPIVRQIMPITGAIELFEADGQTEKINLLHQLDREIVSVYYCGQVFDYFYGHMVPSTGYLPIFELDLYLPSTPGLILRFPEKEHPNKLPDSVRQIKLAKVFREAELWGKIMECSYLSALNKYIATENIHDLIWIAEGLHEKKIAQIADNISSNSQYARVILVAGPSSSGKTTFAQRLKVQLRANGLRPVSISLDDYFVDRDKTPLDENGEFDFESIEAIDLELFNEHLAKLLSGEAVEMPFYNFLTGQREYRVHIIKISKDQPLIIKGMHGLNERLTSAISRNLKAKKYISALTQFSIDNHNRIPTTDTCLFRGIVRDSQFRGHDALRTIKMWQAVRRGEEKNIFPFQEDADIMFNSALIYELAVLKKYVEPLLEVITCENPEYSVARRLLGFLAYFDCVDDEEIFPNSILREFVGNSCFLQIIHESVS